jgi:ribonucleoside-diphosphate reductase alpha chain
MTSENAEKTFDVTPSQHITEYVSSTITNPYIKSQVTASLEIKVHDEEISEDAPHVETI